jgi:superfamily I DNA and RNA helicase
MAIQNLMHALQKMPIEGTFYAGYPIIASADSNYTLEGLLISVEYGLVVFNCPAVEETIESIKEGQDRLYYLIEGNLKKNEILRKGKDLAVKPQIVSFFPTDQQCPQCIEEGYLFAGPDTLQSVLKKCKIFDKSYYRPLCASIQRVTTIKPAKKRENVQASSRGAILKTIEKEIANLDQWQKKAAIEISEGPQRIRGLAGSGKTIVLAIKAAYLHTEHPDWNIVVTFHTRSLSQQFKDLIERFVFDHSGDRPNWNKLQILHAWGSSDEPGVYSEIADALNVVPINYAVAKSKYSAANAFEGICGELLSYINNTSKPIYDAVLIDEAQDLPIPFFRMVHAFTKPPKRIVWAYDELQNLSNTLMPPIEDLFGKDENGYPLVSVNNKKDEAQQDIVLPVCYRNTLWALTLAHALGFGIYRKEGLVQLFEQLSLWQEIGYVVDSGTLDFGFNVTLQRNNGSSPSYFKELIEPEDAVVVKNFDDPVAQYEWVAKEIHRNISEEGLDPDDILIIFPDAYFSRQQFQVLSQSLIRMGLNAHLAGVSTSRDTFFQKNSITAASIYRAKGNEAPMVYIVNSDWCAFGQEMIRLRNVLFTAITRSRAWVRICGVGNGMTLLEEEISSVRDKGYKLSFKIPTQEKLQEIRLINRDRTPKEKAEISDVLKTLKKIEELIDSGTLNPNVEPKLKNLIDKLTASNFGDSIND